MVGRLEEILARLSEVDLDEGLETWHVPGCAYRAGFGCDCMRADLEYLADLVTDQGHLIADLLDQLNAR